MLVALPTLYYYVQFYFAYGTPWLGHQYPAHTIYLIIPVMPCNVQICCAILFYLAQTICVHNILAILNQYGIPISSIRFEWRAQRTRNVENVYRQVRATTQNAHWVNCCPVHSTLNCIASTDISPKRSEWKRNAINWKRKRPTQI